MDQNRDEVKEYLDARYIGAVESCWHMNEFSMHGEYPPVYRLPVHLEDEQTIYFNPDDTINEVIKMLPGSHILLLGSKQTENMKQLPQSPIRRLQNLGFTMIKRNSGLQDSVVHLLLAECGSFLHPRERDSISGCFLPSSKVQHLSPACELSMA